MDDNRTLIPGKTMALSTRCRWNRLAIVVAIVSCLASIGSRIALSAEAMSAAAKLVTADRILVIAHRGDSEIAPENTLPAFESAVKAGCDLVELDYVHTKDGIPLVIHDATLDRTTNARMLWGGEKLPVAARLLAELEPLDAGAWFNEKFRGTRLPTLDQSLDVIQNGSVTLIERKAGDAKTCFELLKKKGLLESTVVQAFEWDYLADLHRLAPEVTLGALGFEELTDQKLAAIGKTGAQVVGWQAKYLTPEGIAKLHAAGYRVWAWTVDDMPRAEKLAAAGVDGIITNKPAQVKALNLAHHSAATLGK